MKWLLTVHPSLTTTCAIRLNSVHEPCEFVGIGGSIRMDESRPRAITCQTHISLSISDIRLSYEPKCNIFASFCHAIVQSLYYRDQMLAMTVNADVHFSSILYSALYSPLIALLINSGKLHSVIRAHSVTWLSTPFKASS
jgi:hypothetical protein